MNVCVNFERIFGELSKVVVSAKGRRIWDYTSVSFDTVTCRTNFHSTYVIKNKHIQKNIS